MKKLMIIFIIIVAVVAVLAVIISMQPSDFRVSRSATIAAPPVVVFEQVNDLHKWDAWSPWAKMDPNAKQTFDGPPSGPGASFTWAGAKVGEGKMTVTGSKPNESILLDLQFFKPMQGRNVVEFTFKPDGNQTVVTWTMTGKNNFMGKAFSLVVNCEKMCGGQFEQGLADMKKIAEASAAAVK